MDNNRRRPGEDEHVDEAVWNAMSQRPVPKKEKKRKSRVVTYAMIGFLLGSVLGLLVLNNVPAGAVIGLCLGYGGGSLADARRK